MNGLGWGYWILGYWDIGILGNDLLPLPTATAHCYRLLLLPTATAFVKTTAGKTANYSTTNLPRARVFLPSIICQKYSPVCKFFLLNE